MRSPRAEEKAISVISKPDRLTLILGGARSGKSRFAESLFADEAKASYIATAQARDAEMTARIERHKKRRGAAWQTFEEPLDLVTTLGDAATAGHPILVDCLTLWLSNLMEDGRDIDQETTRLTDCLGALPCPVVMVAGEVGQGIVPANALARQFRDHAGELNQKIAAIADRVYFVTAGIPAQLK
jgi:adenosylcobinamide kinase/adenosylcobinamide-phosphate guanylyltransferase